MQMNDSSSVEPVQVFIRIRPESDQSDIKNDSIKALNSLSSPRKQQKSTLKQGGTSDFRCVIPIDDHTVKLSQPDGTHANRKTSVAAVDDKIFAFDKIFTEDKSQEDLYSSVSPHVRVIPRAISEIFSIIEATAAEENDIFFYVRLSYVELYNNTFRNLLEFASKEISIREIQEKDKNLNTTNTDDMNTSQTRPSSRPTSPTQMHPTLTNKSDKIEVRESPTAGVFLAGNNLRIPVTTAQEAFQLIAKGNKSRATGSTLCNEMSSRSHAILTIHVESRNLAVTQEPPFSSTTTNNTTSTTTSTEPTFELRLGKMHLVDLAGSERVSLSGAEGETLLETQNINLSLSALGDVLSALSKNAAILSSKHKTTPGKDVIGDTGIHAVTTEIDRLRKRLDDRSSEFDRLRLVQMKDAKENLSLKTRLQQLNTMNEAEKRQLEMQMSHIIHSQAGQLAVQREKISSLQTALESELAVSHNRIVEQEKEIKWLKRALDDSSQAAQQPVGQLMRMQQVLDALQAQTASTQEELAVTLRQNDELRSKVSALSSELTACRAYQKQLQIEFSAKLDLESQMNITLNHCQEQLRIATSTRDKLLEENDIMKKQLQKDAGDHLTKSEQMKDTLLQLQLTQTELSSSKSNYERLQQELSDVRNKYQMSQERLNRVEKDRTELNERWHSNIGELEQKVSGTIDDASRRLHESEESRRLVEEKLKVAERIAKDATDLLKKFQSEMKELLNKKQTDINDLQSQLQHEQETVTSLLNKLKITDELNHNLKEENQNLYQNQKENESSISHTIDSYRKQLEMNIQEMQNIQSSHRQIIINLKSEHTKNINELDEKYQVELQRLKNEVSSALQVQRLKLQSTHAKEIESLRIEFNTTNEHSLQEFKEKEKVKLQQESLVYIQNITEQMKNEYELKIQKLIQEYNVQIQELNVIISEKNEQQKLQSVLLKSTTEQARIDMENALNELKISLTKEYQLKITLNSNEVSKTLEKSLCSEYEGIIKKLKSSHDENRQKYELNIHNLQEQINSLQEEYNKQEKFHNEYIKNQTEKSKLELEFALSELRSILSKEHQMNLQHLKSMYEDTKDQSESIYQSKIHDIQLSIENKYSHQIQLLHEEKENSLNNLRKDLESHYYVELNTIRTQHSEQYLEIDQKHLQQMHRATQDLKEELNEKIHEIDELKRLYSTLQLSHNENLSQEKIDHENEVQSIKMDYKRQYDIINTERNIEVNKAIDSGEIRCQELVNQFQSKLKEGITSALQTQRSKLILQHEKIIENINQELKFTQESLLSQQQEHEKAFIELESKLKKEGLEALQKEIEASLSAQRIKLLEEFQIEKERISIESLENQQKEYEKLSNEYNLTIQSLHQENNMIKNDFEQKIFELNKQYEIDLNTHKESSEKEFNIQSDKLQEELHVEQDLISIEILEKCKQDKENALNELRSVLNREYESQIEKIITNHNETLKTDLELQKQELTMQFQERISNNTRNHQVELQKALDELQCNLETKHELDIAMLKKQHEVEVEKALENLRQELNTSNNNILKLQLEDMESTHGNQLRALSLKYQSELSNMNIKHNDELQSVISNLQEKLQVEHQSTLLNMELAYRLKLDSNLNIQHNELISKHALEIDVLRQSHKETMDTAIINVLNIQNDEINIQHQLYIESLNKMHKNEIENTLANQSQSLKIQYTTEIEKLIQDHNERIQTVTQSVTQTVTQLLQENHSTTISTMVINLQEKYKQELQVELQLQEERLLMNHQNELEMINIEHKKQLEITIENIKRSLRNDISEEFQNKIKEIKTNYYKELELNLKIQYNTLIQLNNHTIQDLIASHKLDLETSLEELKKNLNAEYEKRLNDMEAKYTADLYAINKNINIEHTSQMDTVLNTARLEWDKSLEIQLIEYENRLQLSLEEERMGYIAKLEELQTIERIERDKAIHEIISNHIIVIDGLKQEYTTVIDGLKQEHTTEHTTVIDGLKQEHTTVIDGLKQEHITVIDGLKQEHTTVIDGLKQEHTTVIDGLKQEYTTYIAKMDELKRIEQNEHLAELESLRSDHITTIENALTTLRNELLETHQKTIDMLQSQHQERLHMQSLDFESRYHSVTNELLGSYTELMETALDEQRIELENVKIKEIQEIHQLHMEEIQLQLNTLRESLENEHSIHVTAVIEELTQCKQREIDQLSLSFTKELEIQSELIRISFEESTRVRLDCQREQLEKEFNQLKCSEIETLAWTHEENIQRIKNEAVESINELKNQYTIDLNNELDILRNNMECSHSEELKTFQERHASEIELLQQSYNENIMKTEEKLHIQHQHEVQLALESALQNKDEDSTMQLQKLSESYDVSLQNQLHQLRTELDVEYNHKLEVALNTLREKLTDEYDFNIEVEVEEHKAQLQEALSEQRKQLSTEYKSTIDLMTAEHKHELEELEAVLTNQYKQLEEEYQTEISILIKRYETDLEKLQLTLDTDHMNVIEDLKRTHRDEMDTTLNSQKDDLLTEFERERQELVSISESELERRLSVLRNQMDVLHKEEVEVVVAGIKAENQLQLEEMQSKLQCEYESTLEDLIKTHGIELNDALLQQEQTLHAQHESTLNEVQRSLSYSHQNHMEELSKTYERDIEEVLKRFECISIPDDMTVIHDYDSNPNNATSTSSNSTSSVSSSTVVYDQGFLYRLEIQLEELDRIHNFEKRKIADDIRYEVETSYQNRIESIQLENSSQEGIYKEEINKLSESINVLTTELTSQQVDMERIRTEDSEYIQSQLLLLENKHIQILSDIKHTHAEEIQNIIKTNKIELESILHEKENELNLQFNMQLEESLKKQMKEMEDSFQLQLEEKEKHMKVSIEELITKQLQLEEDLHKSFNEKIHQLELQHKNEMDELLLVHTDRENRNKSDIETLMDDYASELLNIKESLTMKFNAERIDFQHELEVVRINHITAMNSLESERVANIRNIDILRAEHSKLVKEMAKDKDTGYITSITMIQTNHENEIQRLLSIQEKNILNHREEIQKMENLSIMKLIEVENKLLIEHENKCNDLKNEYNTNSVQLQKDFEQKIIALNDLNNTLQMDFDRMKVQYDELHILYEHRIQENRILSNEKNELNQLNILLTEEISIQNDKYMKEILNKNEEYNIELISIQNTLQESLITHQNEITSLLSEISSLKEEYELKIENDRIEREVIETEQESLRLRLITEAEMKIENLLRETNEKYLKEYNEKIHEKEHSLLQKHAQEIHYIQSKYETDIVELQKNIVELQEEIEVNRCNYEIEVNTLKSQHENTLNALQDSINENEQIYTIKIENVKNEYEEKIIHLKHSYEIDLSNNIEKERNEFQNKLNSILIIQNQELHENKQLNQDINILKLNFETERTLLQMKLNENEKDLKSLQCEYISKFDKQTENIIELQEKLTNLQEKYLFQSNKFREDLVEKDHSYENSIENINNKHTKEIENYQHQITTYSSNLEEKDIFINKLQSEIITINNSLSQIQSSLQENQEQLKIEKDKSHQHELALEVQHQQEKDTMELEYKSKISDIITHGQVELQHALELYNKETDVRIQTIINGIENKHEITINEIQNHHKDNINRLQEEYRISIENIHSIHNEQIQSQELLKSQLKSQITTLELQISALETQITLNENELNKERNSSILLQSEKTWMESRLREMSEQMEGQYSDRSNSHREKEGEGLSSIEVMGQLPKEGGKRKINISNDNDIDSDNDMRYVAHENKGLFESPPLKRDLTDSLSLLKSNSSSNKYTSEKNHKQLLLSNQSNKSKILRTPSPPSKYTSNNNNKDRDSPPSMTRSISESISLSPSLRASPVDQLVAAILDGDIQGVRAIIRSRGGDLNSSYWQEMSSSILPLHRAVSGLHFHGSERQLVGTLEALIQLGANIHAADQAGNTVLHKALQICTSKSIISVVRSLISKGVNVNIKNKDGDYPLHIECRRIRSASVAVIECLLEAGANVNSGGTLQHQQQHLHVLDDDSSYSHNYNTSYNTSALTSDGSTSTSSARMWIQAADTLVKAGALWDSNIRLHGGKTQLHLLIGALPVITEEYPMYIHLIQCALQAKLDVCIDDDRDRTGRTLLDIEEKVMGSCLSVIRPLLIKLYGTTSLSPKIIHQQQHHQHHHQQQLNKSLNIPHHENNLHSNLHLKSGKIDENDDWVLYDHNNNNKKSKSNPTNSKSSSRYHSSKLSLSYQQPKILDLIQHQDIQFHHQHQLQHRNSKQSDIYSKDAHRKSFM
eukprot:gene281-505_t